MDDTRSRCSWILPSNKIVAGDGKRERPSGTGQVALAGLAQFFDGFETARTLFEPIALDLRCCEESLLAQQIDIRRVANARTKASQLFSSSHCSSVIHIVKRRAAIPLMERENI